MYLSLLEN